MEAEWGALQGGVSEGIWSIISPSARECAHFTGGTPILPWTVHQSKLFLSKCAAADARPAKCYGHWKLQSVPSGPEKGSLS